MAENEKNNDATKPALRDDDATQLQSERDMQGRGKEFVPYLVVVQGPHQGMKFPLKQGDNVLGRLMGSDVLLEDQSVSRRHSIVTQSRDGWTVEDYASKNGTFVNANMITQKITIGHGDVVQLGIYSLRLITRPVSKEEEIASLPADWEGKTIMVGSAEETKTTMGDEDEIAGEEDAKAKSEAHGVPDHTGNIEVPQEIEEGEPKKKRPLWWNVTLAAILIIVISGGGLYAYFSFIAKPKKPVAEEVKKEEVKPEITTLTPSDGLPVEGQVPPSGVPGAQIPGAQGAVPGAGQQLPTTIPVFLDFASSPLPATVSFQGQDYGSTPVKVQVNLEVGKSYIAEAIFDMKEIGEKHKEEFTFTVDREKSLIPILFKGPIGVLKIVEMPRDVELYLEGYFVYDPFNAKPAKLEGMVFGKPIYVPYGKYNVELRKAKELIAGSGEFVKDIRYKREMLITEDNPIYQLKIAEQDLNEFPAEVTSVPENADVFIDSKKVGVTPYKGILPLGDHTLSLRKDGYFEYKQDFKMDINTLFKTEVTLKTTAAGENINAAKYLIQSGKYNDAVNKLTEVFKQTPSEGETAQARYLIGSCFVYLNNLASAEGYFKQALENESTKQAAQLGLVSVYYGLKRNNEAIPLLVDVLVNAKTEPVKKDAMALFRQISPLRSMMYIYTEPAGATVLLNEKKIEQPTPIILPDMSLGNYKVRIEKDGYMPQDLNINMAVNEFNPIIVKLNPVPK